MREVFNRNSTNCKFSAQTKSHGLPGLDPDGSRGYTLVNGKRQRKEGCVLYSLIASLAGDYTRQLFTVGMTQLQFWMAALLFAIPIKKRRPLWPRVLASLGIWLALLALAVWIRTRWPDVVTRLPVMFINIGFTLPVLFLILDDHPFSMLSTWCAVVAAEEIVATVYDVIMAAFGIDTSAALLFFTTGDVGWDLLLYLLIRFLLTASVYLIFGRRRLHSDDTRSMRQIAFLSTMILILFTLFSAFTQEHRGESLPLFLISRGYALAFALLILLIRSGIVSLGQARTELAVMERVMAEERKQYEQNRENIALINMRCHDLKHQLANLAGRLTDEEVQSLQEAMNIYDSTIKTGSEVLDVVLYENQLACRRDQIQLSCLADGRALSFMRTRHIYALFSNALRNAMEAVRKVEDPEQRIISMNVEDLGEEVAVTVTNYYAEEPDIRDGVAYTGKQDVNRHGFGTMSMRYIAEQYHGRMAMEARNGIFRLYITLRKPEAET